MKRRSPLFFNACTVPLVVMKEVFGLLGGLSAQRLRTEQKKTAIKMTALRDIGNWDLGLIDVSFCVSLLLLVFNLIPGI